MPITHRELILDLYLFDHQGRIAVVDRSSNDIYLPDTATIILLRLPLGQHPIGYIREYLANKGISVTSVELLPALYQNFFDSEPENEYLVTSYRALTDNFPSTIPGDPENQPITPMTLDEFNNHPRLTPEFKSSGYQDILRGQAVYYSGAYQDSDGSNKVLQFTKF